MPHLPREDVLLLNSCGGCIWIRKQLAVMIMVRADVGGFA